MAIVHLSCPTDKAMELKAEMGHRPNFKIGYYISGKNK